MFFIKSTKNRLILSVILIVLSIFAAIGSFFISTNYDMSLYLPADSNTSIALKILKEEFGTETSIQLMIKDTSVEDVLTYKALLMNLENVHDVVWLDDYVDLSMIPLQFIPQETLLMFYNNQNALLTITFLTDSYDFVIEETLFEIESVITNHSYALRGDAIEQIESRTIASGEVLKIMFLIIPIIIIVLMLASRSFVEPVIILLVLGVGVLWNMGSNALLPSISFITMTMAIVLQLAITLDYALFLIHRYEEERENSSDKSYAIGQAFKKSMRSITTSALTTVMGFVALWFMQYQIGFDIGFVLAKGIILSYLSVILLMPLLLYYFDFQIMKTRHARFLPSLKFLGHLFYPKRIFMVIIFIILSAVALYFSGQTQYLYGHSPNENLERQIYQDQSEMTLYFGPYQMIVVMVENQQIIDEIQLASALYQHPMILHVTSLVTITDPTMDRSLLPDDIKQPFVGPNYTRFILMSNVTKESDALFDLDHDLHQIISTYYDHYYMLGLPSSTSDIRSSVLSDHLLILILSAVLVGLVIMIAFKSLIIPVILVLVIQSAIWMNIALLYLGNTQIMYIGYLVVMSIQLGATIDYAVLLTNRYIENRKTQTQKESMIHAFSTSGTAILISATVLAIAGFLEGYVSNIKAITDIGILLGRGAIISFLCVIIFLPALLFITDRLIIKKETQ